MLNDHTDHIWKTHMQTLTQRMRMITTGEIVCKAISDWYFENGKPEPNWRVQKDPQWWIDYLASLDEW